MRAFAALATAVLLVGVSAVLAAEVTSLPGFDGKFPSKMYAGYMTVNESTGRQIYYMFFEAFTNPSSKPLALWLTGGPGCSGLIAAFSEHGPFNMKFSANGTGVELNPYAWSNEMNMIYIESPVGVGFSNVPGAASYTTGDRQTADDTYAFLQGFLKEFPQFVNNDFWVTGESYGGHYVPEIVNRVLDGNAVAKQTNATVLNLKGWMVGNPWTDPETEAWGVVQNWWDRAIIGKREWDAIQAYCDYKDITFWIINNATAGGVRGEKERAMAWHHNLAAAREQHGWFLSADSAKCFDALNEATNVQFGAVDIEGVYRDQCVPGVQQLPLQINPCSLNQLQTYLNLPEVRTAIYASSTVPQAWAPCTAPPALTYSTYDTQQSVLYVYERAMQSTDLKILVYSGDNDAIVPYTGTRMWIERLARPVVTGNHQWFVATNGQQVGGWATQYDKFTFTTVRGAGHMVPYMEPQRALHMIRGFLANHTL